MKTSGNIAYNGYSVDYIEKSEPKEKNLLDRLGKGQSVCCPDERWATIPRFPDYEISTCGRVKRGHKYPAISIAPRGYAVVNVSGKTQNVHTLVLETFVGPRPDKQCACHYDGEQPNNHLSNLRWDTYVNNFKDRDRHNHTCRGSQMWSTDLEECDVRRIRRAGKLKLTHVEIGEIFGVSGSTITRILNGQSWKHVE